MGKAASFGCTHMQPLLYATSYATMAHATDISIMISHARRLIRWPTSCARKPGNCSTKPSKPRPNRGWTITST